VIVFNTGVDATLNPLADGMLGDPHYQLISVPEGSTTGTMVRTSAGGFPIGPWLGDDSISAWIGPSNDAQLNSPNGIYDYRMTFDLTGFKPATALLSGQWAADDSANMLINGVPTGTNATGFSAFTGFSITSGFIAGVNTLDFIVLNAGGGPTGLRVEISGTADAATAIPEPVSLVLLGAGLIALSALRRRVRTLDSHPAVA
jgi:hypothetical protein